MNRFSHAPDFLDSIAGLSSAIWNYAGLSACFELGIVGELGAPITAADVADRLGLEPELVEDLIGVLVVLGAAERVGVNGHGPRYVATPPSIGCSLHSPGSRSWSWAFSP